MDVKVSNATTRALIAAVVVLATGLAVTRQVIAFAQNNDASRSMKPVHFPSSNKGAGATLIPRDTYCHGRSL